MLRLDVRFNGREYTFSTNDNGSNLFEGVSENNLRGYEPWQIYSDSGYNSLRRMKKAIRELLHYRFEIEHGDDVKKPRIQYTQAPCTGEWRA